MHKPYKKITAQLLLFSFLLESCYNPNIGIGKRALPTPADPADKQGQYAGESHDKYPPKPPSHTWTTADKHPVRFTYHSGQWQAAIKEYAANGSSQHRQLPVVFEPGLTLEDVVNSNPTQQKQLLHLCPSQEDPDQPGYVYVGRAPSQAKPHPQLLSSPAARQTVLPSQVGLAQQQATAQPRQGETSPQQAQDQPGRQAVRALPSPVQQIGEGPRSQNQLPTTPARATSKPLPAPSSASPSQGVANTQPTSPQGAPTRRAFSLRNQHELLHSQRAAQTKRAQSAAMAKPGNQLAQPAAPSQAIVSLTPAHPPSLSDKAPPGIASQNLLAQGGQHVRFMHHDGQWWASVRERIGVFSRVWVLPVACERHGDVAKALADLQDKPTQYTQRRIHVMHTKQTPYVPQFVYLGAQGLQGGGNGAGEPSGSGEPQDEPAAEEAAGSELSQSAPQGSRTSLVTLHECMAREDITSTKALVDSFNAAQPAEQQALQQWIEKYIDWFNEECVKSLPKEEEIQEYTSLAHIQADTPAKRQLLASYFYSLCNKVKQGQYGEEPLLRALEYTLQNMDSEVFGGDPSKLITLGKDLLAKLDTDSNQFTKATYPTYRSTLYALHQTLVLVQGIAPGQWDEGIYNRFKKKVEAIADNDEYYPFCYHALLLAQILERLKSEKYRARLKRMRIVDGLRAGLAIGQVVVSAAAFKLDTDAIQQICKSLQAAFSREGIEAKSWYDRYQDIVQCIHALEDIEGEIKDFLGNCQSLKDAFASENMEEKTWYDWHQALKYASLLSLGDASKYSVFEQGLESVQKAKLKNETKEGRKALGFGIVQQLRLLALHGPSGEVRKQSIQWLEALANPEAWGGDPAVMEGLLDGLAAIAVQSQGAEKEQAEKALKSLTDSPPRAKRTSSLGGLPFGNCFSWGPEVSTALREVAAKKALQAWLGGQELADKLSAISAPSETPASGDLFRTIHSLLSAEAPVASQSPAAAQAARQELRKYYQQPDFAQVKSLFEGEAPKHVDSLQCELKLIEQVKVKADREGPQSDLSTHHERLEWVKNPIALEDLFKNRSTKSDEPARAIHKVLLVGEPGTGKTTLSRRLAYRWTKDKWGKELKAVYVLPVRALQQSQYDNGHNIRRTESLATAIVNNCFPAQNEDEAYERLRQQISEELKQPTTLVVLDGLDERAGASDVLLSQAKAGSHKLLMLSRPYGIEQERTMVDIEIEHAGFNDGQMEAYVRDNLSPELGEELLSFIKAYPAIASIAHVPVNLQILCFLWRDNQASVRQAASNGSLPGLYRRLTEYVWERYVRERKVQDESCEELFDTLGKIALDALQQGQVLISPELVRDHVKAPRVRDKLKDSGFLLFQALDSKDREHSQYQFPHLTFQEYFAGRALARQLFSSKAKVRKEAEKFLSKHQYAPQYGRMLSFLAGEVSKEQGVDGLRKLLSLLQEAPQEVVGVQHVLLQMRLLNEWLCVAGEDWEEELADLEEELPVMASLEEWFGEGLDRVRRGDDRRGDDRALLSLLTRGLQGSRAVAAHAPALLPPLLAAAKDESWNVRDAASRALAQVAKAAPALAEKVLEPLIDASKDEDLNVREAASRALSEVAKAAPALAEKGLEPLLAAAKDEYSYVRYAASSALAEVAKAAPALAEKVLEPLLAAAKDEDADVRKAARSALAEVAKAAPALAEKVLEPLLAAAKDSEDYVRRAARSALAEVAKAAPEKVLEPLLAASKDEDSFVRSAASSALAEVAKAAPEKVLEPLLAASKDEDLNVRSDARSALAEVAKAAPGQAEQVLPPLLEALRDQNDPSGSVRSAASYALGKVVAAAPGQAEKVLPPLLEALRDQNDPYGYVRSAASSALAEVAKAAPALAEKVLEPLLAAYKDEDLNVRSAAIEALAKVAKAAPALAEKVLEPLIAASKDEDYPVRSDASRALAEVAQAAPALAEKVLEPLIAASKDEYSYVREAASRALAEVAQAAPEKVLEPLIAAYKDEDYPVRSAARSALAAVAKAAPALAEKVLEPLIDASKDEDLNVRSAASRALAEVAKAAPALAEKVLAPLLAAAKDEDSYVRSDASRALSEVAKAAPEKVLEPLLAAAKDSESYVREAARSALGKFSLQQLIDGYWATQHQALKQGLIPLIATRLYHTPLLVRTSLKRHHQKLFLYPTAAKKPVEWEQPHEEVQCFVKQVKSVGKLQHVEQVLQSLVEDMRHADALVRLAAGKALGAVVHAAPQRALEVLPRLIEASPEHAPALLEPLLAVSKASASDVRYAAIKALREVLKAAPQQAEQVPEGTFVNQASSDGRTPLMSAAEQGYLELAQFLVEKGADANQATTDGRTPLMIAAEKGHLELAQFLVDKGAAVNQATTDGKTPLWIAAKHGHLAVVQYLQEKEANIEAADKEGRTLLHLAAQAGHEAVVEFLQEAGANIETADKYGRTPLWSAAQNGRSAVVECLQEAGANIETPDKEGKTPLMIAAEKEHLELAQFLVEKGADVHQATTDGRTPLIIAAQKGHLAVVEYLQKAGANIEATDKEGKTPLHIAAQAGHLEMVEYLQEAGANIETPDKEGKTPLWIAAKHGYLAVVACLQKAGANLEATDKDGRTPLWIAAQKGHLAVVACLQKAGANIEATDKEGKTPLWIAKEYGCSAVVQFLEGAQESQQAL